MAEADRAPAPDARAVGTAMGEPREHALDVGPPGGPAVESEHARDAAHGTSLPVASLGSISVAHVDQPLGREPGEEIEQVGLEPVGSDVVLGEQLVAQGGDADGLLDDDPDARTDPIEGVVDARLELEHRGFASEVAGNLASSRDDDRLQ